MNNELLKCSYEFWKRIVLDNVLRRDTDRNGYTHMICYGLDEINESTLGVLYILIGDELKKRKKEPDNGELA
jgi:hypothetical protein